MKLVMSCLILIFCESALGYFNASDDDLFGISENGIEIHLRYGDTNETIDYAVQKHKALIGNFIYSDSKNISYGICQYEEGNSIFACTNLDTGKVTLKYDRKTISSTSSYFKKVMRAYKALYGIDFRAPSDGLPAYICSLGCSDNFTELLIPDNSNSEVTDDC